MAREQSVRGHVRADETCAVAFGSLSDCWRRYHAVGKSETKPASRKCLSVVNDSLSPSSCITMKLVQSVNEYSWSRCTTKKSCVSWNRSGLIHSMCSALLGDTNSKRLK